MAGISAAVGVGQMIAGGVQNKRNRESQEAENEKNRQWEAIMQGRQNAINRANWDMENAYNSPSNITFVSASVFPPCDNMRFFSASSFCFITSSTPSLNL